MDRKHAHKGAVDVLRQCVIVHEKDCGCRAREIALAGPHLRQRQSFTPAITVTKPGTTIRYLSFGPIKKINYVFVTSACARRTGAASQAFERMHNTLRVRVRVTEVPCGTHMPRTSFCDLHTPGRTGCWRVTSVWAIK